ncbi:MAG: LysR family transcriptional regulator [Pseudomonadota bacterium]
MKHSDLSLLPILEQLIGTQSVTASAIALDMSVPTVSRALARLRTMFDDDLLVRSGRRMVLTPKAERIYPQLKLGLSQISGLATAGEASRLDQAHQHFKIRCDDTFAGVIADELTNRIRNAAPKLRVDLVSETGTSDEDLREGRVDLELGGRATFPDEVVVKNLGQQHLVVLMRRDHVLNNASATLNNLFDQEHVLASVQEAHSKPLKMALEKRGLKRKVAIVVPSYYAAGVALSNSDLVATMPAVMGRHLSQLFGLATRPVKLNLTPIQASVAWHSRYRKDPIHTWLRKQIIELVAKQLQVKKPVSIGRVS